MSSSATTAEDGGQGTKEPLPPPPPSSTEAPSTTEAPSPAPASAPVQVTVSAPDAPSTVNLTTVKEETPTPATVSAPVVTGPEPEVVQLTAVQSTVTTANQPQPNDDFYRTIFYFSGMGKVIGSALSEGVYVDEKNRHKAIDPEEAESRLRIEGGKKGGVVEGELIQKARNQAVNLSSDFRQLQSLLGSLPTFTDTVEQRSSGARGLDEPIHGEIYFRSERPELYQQQQQQVAQRMRQAYIIEPGAQSQPIYQHHQQNGHLIDVPWNYHSSY